MSDAPASSPSLPTAAETRMVRAVFPGDTNHYHTLFGGSAMAWMDQAAFICATRWCRAKVVTVHTGEIDFQQPVPEGTIVELVARVVQTGTSSMCVRTEMFIEPMDQYERILACTGSFTLVALGADDTPTQVPALRASDSADGHAVADEPPVTS
ncbi:MAG: acyl-CoA thioesterase [Longimonas sp.]|uniref:acyl-CoA thioesterase n=1 Tax=Longimonas sp. TaxID=2039626 RepID=UPI0039766B32